MTETTPQIQDSAVNWSTLATDPTTAPAVADLVALAAGFDPQVPAVLLPVRVETRFTTVEVPDSGDHLGQVLDDLAAVNELLRGIAGRKYATKLTGTVSEQRAFKRTVEVPVYRATEADMAALADAVAALGRTLRQPITSGTADQERQLAAAVAALPKRLDAAHGAVTTLRSDHQRASLTGPLDVQAAVLEEQLRTIRGRVQPALRFVADLKVRTGAQVARAFGRAPNGRLLRPELRPSTATPAAAGTPGPGGPQGTALRPATRVVLDDGTTAEALGASRVVRLEQSQLVASAEAAQLIADRLADPAAELGPDVRSAAAGITVLPGDLKASLLARLDSAAGRLGAGELRAEIASTPSDRADIDATVPDRTAATVFALPGPTRTVHQLWVRIYPEPLAVDTHEEDLTGAEQADGANFWAETAAAGTDEELRKGAWRALCIGRSTRRAAWVARATEPTDHAESGPTPGAVAAKRIADALTMLDKRITDLGGPRVSGTGPGGRITRIPVDGELRELTDGQRAAVTRALDAVTKAIKAAEALPAAAKATLIARMRTQRAAVKGLALTFADVPPAWLRLVERLATTLAALPVEPPPAPQMPGVGTRSGTWTRAASSTVLPRRFAVFTVAAGAATHVAAGRPVPADLKLGLDPVGDTFSLDEDGSLVMPDSMRWMTDFDEAEAKGMALRLTITAQEAEQGFDEVLVLGLSDGNAGDGADRLTAMLEAHHYTGDGLSLLPIGTPTNNTEDMQAGFSSADDPDQAYLIERGDSLVAANADTDGTRLAAAFGVDAEIFAHVAGADGSDAAEALLTNRAFYPGTVGHALEELAPGLISRDARERLRTYALGHVAARGLLPAIRVTDEPYGLLPAVALSRLTPDLRDSGTVGAAPAEQDRQRHFEETLLELLRHLHADWSRIRQGADGGEAVKHAGSPEIGQEGFDAQQHFLAMLGLEASSVESSYRFEVNVADRGGVRGQPDLNLGFGMPPVAGQSADAAAALGPFALMEHLDGVFRLAFEPPPTSAPRDPATGFVSADWAETLDRIESARAYGLRLLTGLHPVQGEVSVEPTSGTSTGAWILTLLSRTMEDLRARTVGNLSGVGLAELLVRHALLAEERRVAAAILVSRGLLTEDSLAVIGTSSRYQTWSNGGLSRTSSWGLLFATVDHLVELAGLGATIPVDLSNQKMAEHLAASRPAELTEHRDAVTAFAQLPADRMTTLTREHLDLGSYRLDAWLTGLAHRRLAAMRSRRPAGAQVGAYGLVQDLRPKSAGLPATDVPPALAGLPGRPLVSDSSREGFIQTPSPTHAVTAAILRAAYRSQETEGSLGNEMSVNLSSERVRVALSLIDGVRAGNDLGALLGYRLERFLHEYYARPGTPKVELDAAIFALRKAYPTVAAVDPTVDPTADTATDPTRTVVDGLALVRTLLDWVEDNHPEADGTLFQTLRADQPGHPWGTKSGALPARTNTETLIGVLLGIDAIADALDALGDLTTSETVHQLARGNHTRAAAVLSALNDGTAIPHPQVTDTPRTGLPVSHRVILQLPAVPAEPVQSPAGWEAVPMGPRAALEPAVNAWLAALLGDPAAIRVRLTSDALAPGTARPEVSVAGLGLQPLDLVALLADGFDAAVGTLTARVLDLLQPADLPPDQLGVVASDGPGTTATDVWRIESLRAPAWGPGIRSITDVAPLLEACADLLRTAKPVLASDYAAPEFTTVAGEGVALDDLVTRAQRLLDGARSDALTLARLLAEDPGLDASVLDVDPAAWLAGLRDTTVPADQHPSAWLPALDLSAATSAEAAEQLTRLDGFWAQREPWWAAARAARAYGIRVALPRRFLSRTQVGTELLQSVESGFLDLATRCRTASATLSAGFDDPTVPPPASVWRQVATDVLGTGLALVPRVVLDPVQADLQAALAVGLVAPDELDAWLEGAATVRPGAAHLADIQVLAEALARPSVPASVAQLPTVEGEPWLGGALADPSVLAGRVSIALFGADRLPSAGASGTALLVDEWSEQVPYREEVTGVALHYDQPDVTAPQAILVAVPPVADQRWTLTDFAATLHDTLEMARNRMVEVEHIGTGRYGQWLPLLVGEVVPDAAAGDDDRVNLDFQQNNP